LFPNFRAGGLFMRLGISGIRELVDVDRVRDFSREARGVILIEVGMTFAHVRACEANVRPECVQMRDLLLRHLVGNDEHQTIALHHRYECKAKARVSGGSLNDRSTRWKLARA